MVHENGGVSFNVNRGLSIPSVAQAISCVLLPSAPSQSVRMVWWDMSHLDMPLASGSCLLQDSRTWVVADQYEPAAAEQP